MKDIPLIVDTPRNHHDTLVSWKSWTHLWFQHFWTCEPLRSPIPSVSYPFLALDTLVWTHRQYRRQLQWQVAGSERTAVFEQHRVSQASKQTQIWQCALIAMQQRTALHTKKQKHTQSHTPFHFLPLCKIKTLFRKVSNVLQQFLGPFPFHDVEIFNKLLVFALRLFDHLVFRFGVHRADL